MKLTINGKVVEAREGMTVLQIARENGIHIPTLCYLEGVNDIGSCRLCIVEVEGTDVLHPSCVLKAEEGMVVHTDSEKVVAARKTVLRLLLSEHYGDCFSCEKNGDCELQKYCIEYGVDTTKYEGRAWEVKRVRTTCPHCATGCQMDLIVKNGKIVDVEGADGPSNHGLLCVKGRSASFDFVDSPERIRYPLIKNKETGEFERATWEEALDLVADRFLAIRNSYGGEALAGFACSRSTNEDVYMLQKMVRVAFGSNNTDNCARV